MLQYSPKITTDGLVMCLDASQNKSYPTDLPVKNGLVMWMDAADDTTFSYSSGTTVSQWRDKSGFNYHMVPKSGGPTRTSVLNSRKALAFTTSQTIGNNTIDLSTSANTVFVVSRLTGTTNGRVLTCNLDASGNNWLLGHHGGTSNAYYAEGWVYDSSGASTSFQIYMGDWSGSSTDLANFYINGTAYATNNTAASQGPKYLGLNYYSVQTSTCEAAEIIVFNRVLSATERKQIHTYLGQKWGISNTDRSIIDLSGNDDNGLLGNGTVANIPAYDFYNKGTLRFDGSNDYVFLSNSQLNISSAITVEAWVKYNAQGGYNARAYSVITCKGYPWTWLLEDQSGQFNFRISTSVNSDSNVNSSYSHGLNTWNHVVGTYDGVTQKIYVDGVLRNSVALTGAINTSSNDALVGCYNYGDYCLTGNVGAVRIYNKALSAVEVAQNYEAQKSKFANTIIQQGLVLNLDAGNPYSYAGAGTVWYDVSGNSNNGTLTNSPTYSSDVGGTIVFDGVNDYVTTSFATTSGQSVTYCGWLYSTESTSTYKNFVDSLSTSPMIWWNNSGQIEFDASRYTTTTVYRNQWVYVSLSKPSGSSSASYYVNGVLVGTGTAYTTPALIPTLFNRSAAQTWKGNGAVVQIYNRALSASEVLQNYNATKGRFGL